MEKPVEVPEHIGELEKERTVKEFALFVEKGIDEGLYRQNTSISEPDCYYHNNRPSTSNAALAEKAAVKYQIEEDEAVNSANYEDTEQSEEPEADADHERDSGMTLNEDESHESMEVD